MNLNSSEVEEPRACYTEWSKSERETQIQYINANVWNLGKYQWTHSQGRCRCREWTCGHSGESSININTLSGARRRAGEKMLCSTGSTIWWSVMTWRGGGRRGCKYNYGWFALLNGRNQHNIVNIKKKKYTGKWRPARKGLQQLLCMVAPKWKQHKGSSITWYILVYIHTIE